MSEHYAKQKADQVIPLFKIEPLTLAMYNSLNFNQLEINGIKEHRFLAVEVIHDAIISPEGTVHFLVKDRVSDNNRVLRVELPALPPDWGLFCFKKMTTMVIMDPDYVFEYESFIRVADPAKQCLIMGVKEHYLLWVQEKLERVDETCQEIKDKGLHMLREKKPWAAINLFQFILSHPDETLDEPMKMLIYAYTAEAYNSLEDRTWSEVALNLIEEALCLAEEN